MPYRIQLRRDTASAWTLANPVLAQGEIGYETDTGMFKIGDGSTQWSSLAYQPSSSSIDITTALVHSASSKGTPVDDDETALLDSGSSFSLKKLTWANIKATLKNYFDGLYATTSNGVTNGNSHDHSGGDGAQIDHTTLSNIGTNSHSAIDSFIASKGAASGLASLNASSLVVQNPANATSTPTASKIVIADASGKVDSWVSDASTTTKGKVELATDGESAAGLAVQANDSRLTNQRDPNISGMTAETSVADGDYYPMYDAGTSANRKISWANIIAGIKTALGFNSSTRFAGGIEWSNPSDGYGVGIQDSGTSGEALSPGDIVYLKSDGKWWKTDADAESSSGGVLLGVCLSTAAGAGVSINVLLHGKYTETDWAWTPGGAMYLSQTAGSLTQTPPASGANVCVVMCGFAVNADTIFFVQPTSWVKRSS